MTFVAMILAASLQAAAETPARAAPSPAAAAAPAEAEKRVCRRAVPTGSRLGGVSECLTPTEWRERERQNAQTLRETQTRSALRPQ